MKVKFILLFFILWVHITVLNLVVVTPSGLVFFWEESLRVETILIHLIFALIGSGSFFTLVKIKKKTDIQSHQSSRTNMGSVFADFAAYHSLLIKLA